MMQSKRWSCLTRASSLLSPLEQSASLSAQAQSSAWSSCCIETARLLGSEKSPPSDLHKSQMYVLRQTSIQHGFIHALIAMCVGEALIVFTCTTQYEYYNHCEYNNECREQAMVNS